MIGVIDSIFKIDSGNVTMLLRERCGNVELLYLGEKIGDITGAEQLSIINRLDDKAAVDNYNHYNNIFSFFGDGNDKEQFVLLSSRQGITSKFTYSGYKILSGAPQSDLPCAHGESGVLCLEFVDSVTEATVQIFIAAYDDCDALAFSACVSNTGKNPITVKRLFSVQLDYDGKNNLVTSLSGAWASERSIRTTKIDDGIFCIDSKTGASSNKHNPFVAVTSADNGFCLGLCPIYSGNHKFILEALPQGQTRVLSGMNDFALDYRLESGQRLFAPQVAVYYARDLSGVSATAHRFVRRHIVPERFKDAERPVLLNNWEATYFDFDFDKIDSLTTHAKDAGIELFVLDDGWFGERRDEKRSLGDWTDNTNKTGGLDKLAAMVKGKGLMFGIWVEPEMVSPKSELFRAHPEYALRQSPEILRRSQLMLDLTNLSVQNHILESLTKVFTLCRPDYCKWDYNRTIGEIPHGGKYFYDYTAALYRIVKEITTAFPDILFEGCAAGGNRFDLGMLCFMPQIWASDNTDARDRLAIHAGTLTAYPQCTMGAHVSASPNHQTQNLTPLKERFIVACAGLLGYELDITKCTQAEKEEIARQTAYYKKHRRLLQFGQRKSLPAPENYVIYGVYGEGEAMVTVIRTANATNVLYPKFKLGSFDPLLTYTLSAYGSDKVLRLSGEVLNGGALDVSFFLEGNNTNSISAMLLHIAAYRSDQ